MFLAPEPWLYPLLWECADPEGMVELGVLDGDEDEAPLERHVLIEFRSWE